MNTYSYSLVEDNDTEIRDFVVAEDITAAYAKVISIIEDLNAVSKDYVWQFKTLENCYFVGVQGRIPYSDHDCDDVKCDCCE